MFSSGFAEIVLIVPDVRTSAAFYRDVVGLIPETEPDDAWAWFWMGPPGQNQRLALHRGPLLFEEHSPQAAGARWGPIHFALEVPRARLDGALAHLRAKQIALYGPIELNWMQAISWYFYDPDGNLLEFWSRGPDAP